MVILLGILLVITGVVALVSLASQLETYDAAPWPVPAISVPLFIFLAAWLWGSGSRDYVMTEPVEHTVKVVDHVAVVVLENGEVVNVNKIFDRNVGNGTIVTQRHGLAGWYCGIHWPRGGDEWEIKDDMTVGLGVPFRLDIMPSNPCPFEPHPDQDLTPCDCDLPCKCNSA